MSTVGRAIVVAVDSAGIALEIVVGQVRRGVGSSIDTRGVAQEMEIAVGRVDKPGVGS